MARNYKDYTYLAIKKDWSELWVEMEDGKHVKYTGDEVDKLSGMDDKMLETVRKFKKVFGGEVV
jgi:hypothetical protein